MFQTLRNAVGVSVPGASWMAAGQDKRMPWLCREGDPRLPPRGWVGNVLPFLAVLLSLARLHAQQPADPSPSSNGQKILRATRIATPIQLDGELSESVWEEAESAEQFVQAEPYEGKPATERTEVKVLYDAANLYVGVYCYDQEPSKILISSVKEDFNPRNSDSFEVILDTFQDGRNGYLFITDPVGDKRDAQVTDEGRNVDADWDTVWDVRAQSNGDGWTAEMVIPFKSLSFNRRRVEQVWGINFSRGIRRKNEIAYWSPVPRRYDISRLSLAGELQGLEEIQRGRNLRVKPFVVSDLNQYFRRDSVGATLDGGVDAKYSVTPSLTLDLTFNTDFSQVEVDEQQINLTRFPLFFPEKREFFLENSGIFQLGDIPLERGPDRSKETQLFFSRRIGLSESGEPIPIWGGARLSGRIGKYSLGLLSMQTKDTRDHPGNNFVVARLRRNILTNSDFGALFVSRRASAGKDFNRTFGVDGNFRFWQNLTVNSYLAKTQTDGLRGHNRAEKISTEWRDNRLRFQLMYSGVGENFHPEVGFTQRRGVRYLRNRTDVRLRPRGNSIIREFSPHFQIEHHLDTENRTVSKHNHYAPLQLYFHNSGTIELSYNADFDRLQRPFPVRSNITIPPGGYQFAQWQLEASSDSSRKLSGNLDLRKGGYYSGNLTAISVGGTFRPHYRFSVQGSYSRNRVTLQEGAFTTHLIRSRIHYAFSTRMFLDALLQYNSDRNQISSNLRFDFIHHPLSDLFLVYNEQRDTSGAGKTDRALVLKYTHLLSF